MSSYHLHKDFVSVVLMYGRSPFLVRVGGSDFCSPQDIFLAACCVIGFVVHTVLFKVNRKILRAVFGTWIHFPVGLKSTTSSAFV